MSIRENQRSFCNELLKYLPTLVVSTTVQQMGPVHALLFSKALSANRKWLLQGSREFSLHLFRSFSPLILSFFIFFFLHSFKNLLKTEGNQANFDRSVLKGEIKCAVSVAFKNQEHHRLYVTQHVLKWFLLPYYGWAN